MTKTSKRSARREAHAREGGPWSPGAAVVGAFACAVVAAWYSGAAWSQLSDARWPARRAGADAEAETLAERLRRLRQEDAPSPPCVDRSTDCAYWASIGECETNPGYMLTSCKSSCGGCGAAARAAPKVAVAAAVASACKDDHAMCSTWASIGECDDNPLFMKVRCRVSCRLCQTDACRDSRTDCAERAKGGGCFTRDGMRDECAWTCVSCSTVDEPKCARDRAAPAAAARGSVESLFRRLADADSVAGNPRGTVSVHSSSPWVVSIDNFLSPDEADALLAAGGADWSRSLAGDGVQQVRTSSTSWCRERCLQDPTVIAVQRRVEELTGVPVENAEYMQALRYEPGQFYRVRRARRVLRRGGRESGPSSAARRRLTCPPSFARAPRRAPQAHHDQNSPRASAWGPRLYTFFMYLSDVEAGGGTRFPLLNLTITPAKGRAVLWTSVLDEDPYERDGRTEHEALAVEAGTKYAANYWLHMFPFRSFSDRGCDNAPYINNWL